MSEKYDDIQWLVNNVPCPGEKITWENVFNYSLFGQDEVKEIIAVREGENEGDNWVMVARLKDDKVGVVVAGCDYTGWG